MAAVVIKIAAVVNNKVITLRTLGRSEESAKKEIERLPFLVFRSIFLCNK